MCCGIASVSPDLFLFSSPESSVSVFALLAPSGRLYFHRCHSGACISLIHFRWRRAPEASSYASGAIVIVHRSDDAAEPFPWAKEYSEDRSSLWGCSLNPNLRTMFIRLCSSVAVVGLLAARPALAHLSVGCQSDWRGVGEYPLVRHPLAVRCLRLVRLPTHRPDPKRQRQYGISEADFSLYQSAHLRRYDATCATGGEYEASRIHSSAKLPHRWFCSEEEAQAAGFRKSYTC